MKSKDSQTKDAVVIFRAPRSAVRSLDHMAKLIGSNRSEALRRLIPDLNSRKGRSRCNA
ncbi:ribbon-helix-helix protein, CopG family [Planctomycetota bacterium]